MKKNIIIEVADDGPGFAPEIYPFFGEPYIKNNNKAKKQGSWLRFIYIKKPYLQSPMVRLSFLIGKVVEEW